jgi:hypothetical protein
MFGEMDLHAGISKISSRTEDYAIILRPLQAAAQKILQGLRLASVITKQKQGYLLIINGYENKRSNTHYRIPQPGLIQV